MPKYGDYLRLFLRLHEGDFACYSLRDVAEGAWVVLEARAAGTGELLVSCGDTEVRVTVGAREWAELNTIALPEEKHTVVRVACEGGTVDLKTVRFCHK